MRWWVYKHSNSVSIEVDDEELLERLMSDIQDLITSAVFHKHYTNAKDYIEMYLEIEAAYKELVKKNDPEVIENDSL